jgi:hypothetical protein
LPVSAFGVEDCRRAGKSAGRRQCGRDGFGVAASQRQKSRASTRVAFSQSTPTVERSEKAEPSQQVHPIGALGRRRPAASDELGEVGVAGRDRSAGGVEKTVRLEGITRRPERAHLGHRELG